MLGGTCSPRLTSALGAPEHPENSFRSRYALPYAVTIHNVCECMFVYVRIAKKIRPLGDSAFLKNTKIIWWVVVVVEVGGQGVRNCSFVWKYVLLWLLITKWRAPAGLFGEKVHKIPL